VTEQQDRPPTRTGRTAGVIFSGLALVVLVAVFSWFFSPSVRVFGYQTLLIIAPLKTREWSLERLESYGESAVPALIIGLKDPRANIRRQSASALGALRKKAIGSIPALIDSLRDDDGAVSGTAMLSLILIAEEPCEAEITQAVMNAFVLALKDKNSEVRSGALIGLGDLSELSSATVNQAVIEALVTSLKDQNSEVRNYATIVLGTIGAMKTVTLPQSATEALRIRVRTDTSRYVRHSARKALAKSAQK
jgi:HEAT repeat protein